MRAVASSSPSVKHLSPDLSVRIVWIRPHAHVAAGVSVFVRYHQSPDHAPAYARNHTPSPIRFDLKREIAVHAGLSEDLETTLGTLQDLRVRSEVTFVVFDAVAILARRDHSSAEIRRKLARRGYGEQAIEHALEVLHDREVQDDRAFARAFVEQRMRRRPVSRLALRAALARRGIARHIIDEEIRRYEESEPECFARAAEAAAASMRDRHEIDEQTLLRRLMQRGFSASDTKLFFD